MPEMCVVCDLYNVISASSDTEIFMQHYLLWKFIFFSSWFYCIYFAFFFLSSRKLYSAQIYLKSCVEFYFWILRPDIAVNFISRIYELNHERIIVKEKNVLRYKNSAMFHSRCMLSFNRACRIRSKNYSESRNHINFSLISNSLFIDMNQS